jgi:hypothetical protein
MSSRGGVSKKRNHETDMDELPKIRAGNTARVAPMCSFYSSNVISTVSIIRRECSIPGL